MSEYGHCHRGGQVGICCTIEEQSELAEMLNTKYRDEYIPLPGMDRTTQINIIKEHSEDDTYDNVVYWEDEKGGHGWCNKYTGKVIQWG